MLTANFKSFLIGIIFSTLCLGFQNKQHFHRLCYISCTNSRSESVVAVSDEKSFISSLKRASIAAIAAYSLMAGLPEIAAAAPRQEVSAFVLKILKCAY
jgi:hypothetical protein